MGFNLLENNKIVVAINIKCVYLLVNGDESPNSQLITAQRLVLECLPFTDNAEQAVELHNYVFNARL